MDTSRRVVLLLLALLTAVPTRAAAQTTAPLTYEDIANELGRDSIYSDPQAESPLTPADEQRLSEEIIQADVGPVYIVLISGETLGRAGNNAEAFLEELVGQHVQQPGVYALVVDRRFYAAATERAPFSDGEVDDVGDQAVAANQGESPVELLSAFIAGLPAVAGDPGFGAGPVIALGALAAGVAGFAAYRRRQRRQRERAQVEEVRQEAERDLTSLGNEVYDLEPHMALPSTPREAVSDYQAATNAYVQARTALEQAQRPADLAAVSRLLEEGRYAAASARARLEAQPPPEHRAPCFFDPAHGPSVADVTWAPKGGLEREVPACEEDASRVLAGDPPLTREVTVAGARRPYWEAPSYYGPWAGGYYGGFGGFGMFQGLLLGSILTGGWGGGGWGGGYAGEGDRGDVDAGGDFDGGDFDAGGDFGGDFGGGDF